MQKHLMALFAGIGGSLAIGALTFLDSITTQLFIMAPLGASAVLVFGLPQSPLAQAKNVIFGHLLTAFVGLVISHWLGVSPLTLALATGLAITLMLMTETTHPPAGANPLLVMMLEPSWSFLVTPVLAGTIILVVIGKLMLLLRNKLESDI